MRGAGRFGFKGIVEISVELLDMHRLAGAARDNRQIPGIFSTSRDQTRFPYSCRWLTAEVDLLHQTRPGA
jgi:hypothetical protein